MKRGELAEKYYSDYSGSDVKIEYVNEYLVEYGVPNVVIAELSDGKTVYNDNNVSVYLNTFKSENDIVWDDNIGAVYDDGTQLDYGEEIH